MKKYFLIITKVEFPFSLKNINFNEEIFFMKDISIKKIIIIIIFQ